MPAREPPAPQCVYTEGRRRCRRNGFGRAQLCRAHMLVMQEAAEAEQATWGAKAAKVAERIIAGKRVTGKQVAGGMADLIGAIAFADEPPAAVAERIRRQGAAAAAKLQQEWVERLRAAQDPQPRPQQAPPQTPWNPFQQPPPRRQRPGPAPPPRPPPPPPLDNASRQVLGFAGGQLLTKEAVSDRRRELAKRHHPDRGGKVEAMQRINAAADALLAEIERMAGPGVRSGP